MPHKHTRKQDSDNASFNLAPTVIARPLPASSKRKDEKARKTKRKAPHIANYGADDTPRAFARMIQGQKRRSGLDDEGPTSKKQKTTTTTTTTTTNVDKEPLKLLPGERLADFSARVNQAIPVAGLSRRGKVKVDGVKERQTRKEKKMHKMYADWREEDAKLKAQKEELAEQAEEEEEERLAQYGELPPKRRAIGEIGQTDDPWAVLRKKEKKRRLNDVAQAPPELKPLKERFKVRNGAKLSVADVPASAGSLKKREELSEARKEVIERYRAMMKANRQ